QTCALPIWAGGQCGYGFEVGVLRAGLDGQDLRQLRRLAELPEVIDAGTQDRFIFRRAVSQVGLPQTRADFRVQHVCARIDQPPPVADRLRQLLVVAAEAVLAPVDATEEVVGLAPVVFAL